MFEIVQWMIVYLRSLPVDFRVKHRRQVSVRASTTESIKTPALTRAGRAAMQKFAGSCSPEQLNILQTVFDFIWMELRASSNPGYSGPSDPEALRNEIAQRVFSLYGAEGIGPDQIAGLVLASFGIDGSGLDRGQLSKQSRGPWSC
jgi:hypothetical protein